MKLVRYEVEIDSPKGHFWIDVPSMIGPDAAGRHRLFLSNVLLMGAGGCHCAGRKIGGVYGHGGGTKDTNGYTLNTEGARQAMQMPWADRAGVSLAIPPAYTRFIGEQLHQHCTATP